MSEQILISKVELPSSFLEYVEKKLSNGSGRPHLIKQLGSLEKVLDILKAHYIEGYTIRQLSRKKEFDKPGYYQIYRFIQECNLQKNEIIEYIQYIETVKPKNFESYESILAWKDKITLSGHLSQLAHIPKIKRLLTGQVCSFKCHPDKFNLEKAQELLLTYLKETGKREMPRHLRMPIRHFLASKGECPARGFGGQYGLSGKTPHPKYAHVKLSDQQIEKVKQIMANDPIALNNGYDIGFQICIETCTRAWGLSTIPITRIRKEGNLCIIDEFEPKVKRGEEYFNKSGMWWKKYISPQLYKRIQKFIEQHPERTLLFTDNKTISACRSWLRGPWHKPGGFCGYMKKIYKKLNIKESYFYKHAIHSLRHVGAHYLLEKTSYEKDGVKLYNYELVAKLGGWLTTRILKEHYGAMPESVIVQVVQTMYGGD